MRKVAARWVFLVFFLVFVLSPMLCAMASASDIYVGADETYTTIQAGINAATTGDVVIVRDGTYTGTGNKAIDFKGKAITVVSENGPESCIINLGSSARGFYFHTSETSNSVLSGFTIKNGSATQGGGIYCNAASPTIDNCIITGNKATVDGAGVFCIYSADPTIANCTISANTATDDGGGIYCESAFPTITDCTISGNTSSGYGGGIYCKVSSPTISNCAITGNMVPAHHNGGGLYIYYSSYPAISGCTISGNSSYGGGGGICYYNNSAGSITGSAITGNTYGGGILCGSSSAPKIANCTIAMNTGVSGGISCSSSSPKIINCTIAGNTASGSSGGGVSCNDSSPKITNAIIWGNSPSQLPSSGLTVTYSDVEGGYTGTDNIASDPQFVDSDNGDYHLQDSSPCIDAGTSTGAPSDDIDGNERPMGEGVDMGSDEVDPSTPPAVKSITRSDPASELTNASQVKYSVLFSKAVTGATASNFGVSATGVTGASVSSVSGSGYIWEVTVATGSGDGAIQLNMTSSTGIADSLGNALSSALPLTGDAYTIDKTAPTVSAGADVSANAAFTQTATAADAHDMTYAWTMLSGPGTILFGAANALSTTVEVDVEGTYVLQFTATDAAGNSASDSMTLTWDQTAPTVSIASTASDPTSVNPIPVTITFSETVTGFTVSDISVTNGTASGFSGSGASYTVNITPSSEGDVGVGVAAGVAQDESGNANLAASAFEIEYVDAPPTVSISTTSEETFRSSTMLVTITFSEPVTGFTVSDITATNGTLSDFTAVSSTVYTVVVTPAAEGAVTVQIASGVAVDSAGNSNTASTTLTRTYAKPALSWLPLLLE